MPYSIDVRSDAPIIILSQQPGGDPGVELYAAMADMQQVVDRQPGPVFMIVDLRHADIDLHDHMRLMTAATRGETAIMRHRKIREHIFVGADELLGVVVRGLSSATFGMLRAVHFITLEAALAHCARRLHEDADAPVRVG